MISARFIKSSLIYTVAGALPMASAIILMPFYGKYLSAELFGALSVYFAFSLLVQIIVTYSFDASLYINYHEYKDDPERLGRFISSAFNFILLVSVVVSTALALAGNYLFAAVFGDAGLTFFPFGALSLATAVFLALFKVNNSLLQTQSKPSEFLWTNLLSFSLVAGLTIIGLTAYPDTLWGPIGGKMIAAIGSAAWVLVSIYRQFGFHFRWSLLKTTFAFNHPSLLYQVQQWVINYYDRVLLLLLVSSSTVGYYDLAIKCLLAIDFLLTGLNASFHPKVLGLVHQQQVKTGTIKINRYYHGLAAVAILAVVACIFLFPPLIRLFFPEPYHAASAIVPLAAMVYLLRPVRLFMAMPYAAMKYSKPLPVIYLALAVVKIFLMYAWIPRWGVQGAIFATLFSYTLEVTILYFVIRPRFTFRLNSFKILWAPLMVAAFILVGELLTGTISSSIIHGGYVLVAVALLGWVYRNELKMYARSWWPKD
ncbi:MAG: oligosaccharide flippase family protein [Cyclobacteriaceae bacterium]